MCKLSLNLHDVSKLFLRCKSHHVGSDMYVHCCWGSRSMLFCVANYQFGIIARRGGKTRNSRWSQEENVEQFVFVEATLIIQFAVAVGLWHCSQSSVCCKTRYLSPIVCGYRAVTQHEEKLRHKNKENISYTISQKSGNVNLKGKSQHDSSSFLV